MNAAEHAEKLLDAHLPLALALVTAPSTWRGPIAVVLIETPNQLADHVRAALAEPLARGQRNGIEIVVVRRAAARAAFASVSEMRELLRFGAVPVIALTAGAAGAWAGRDIGAREARVTEAN